MEITWKGYGLILKLEREQVEDLLETSTKRKARTASFRRRPEVEQEYLLASGSRYRPPIR